MIKRMKLSHPGMVASFSVVTGESITVWRKREEDERVIGSVVVPRHDGGVDLWVRSDSDPERAGYYEMIVVGRRWCFAPDWHAYAYSSLGEEEDRRPVWERDPDCPKRMRIWER